MQEWISYRYCWEDMQASRPQFRSSVFAGSDLHLYCCGHRISVPTKSVGRPICSLLCLNITFPPRITPSSYSALRPFLFAGASFESWQNWQIKSSAVAPNMTKKDDLHGAAVRYTGETPSPPQFLRRISPSYSRQGSFTDNRNSANDRLCFV